MSSGRGDTRLVGTVEHEGMMSDVSLSEGSWADARADTPTMRRENNSDSEDTLSSLSFDENGILSPTSGGSDLENKSPVCPKMIDFEPTTVLVPSSTSSRQPPLAAPRSRNLANCDEKFVTFGQTSSGDKRSGENEIYVKVTEVTDNDMDQEAGGKLLNLDLDLPSGTLYKPPTVDFPSSPSQLKNIFGPSFMPKEEIGPVSEDDVSFASSCRAKLDLNLRNGGVRLTKKEEDFESGGFESGSKVPKFLVISEPSESEPWSLATSSDPNDLEDYLEDFYLPHSHETVMQRQTSFRRKVKKELETAVTENAIKELNKFDTMLSTYDEELENSISLPSSGIEKVTNNGQDDQLKIPNDSKLEKNLKFEYGEREEVQGIIIETESAYPSLLDIDAICDTHAPNLMRLKTQEDQSSIQIGELEESSYFIPKTTIDKLYSVYDSNNFHNLYTLSGELRHILSPIEIEEIVANRAHLEKVIDPNVMAALSWSLNEASLPPYDTSLLRLTSDTSCTLPSTVIENIHTHTHTSDLPSKTSSISNGFHSRNTSDASDDEASTTSTTPYQESISSGMDTPDSAMKSENFSRGIPQTGSFRRRIALAKSLATEIQGLALPQKYSEENDEYNSISLSPSPNSGLCSDNQNSGEEIWKSLESLDDLDIEDDIDVIPSGPDDIFFVRRDSRRFSKKGSHERVVEGLFVETKDSSNHGTLKRVHVPLNLGLSQEGLDDTEIEMDLSDLIFGKKVPKKRIPLDEELLRTRSIADLNDSSQATDADMTLSEVFHSCVSLTNQIVPSREDEDHTICSSASTEGDDITLDLHTPDDMADSILGRLDSLVTSPPSERILQVRTQPIWKPFSVGSTEIQIDLGAIQPYRRVLSHGGYFDAEKKVAIILFSGCFLPDRSRREYSYLMDHLFLYVLSTLEELIVEDYILVYLHGATPKACQPSFGWLKRCYQLIDHKLRKNLKGLYLVHPSFWLKTVVALTKPFISSKFGKKIEFVSNLAELCLELPTEHLVIPDPVLQYDFDVKVRALRRKRQLQ